MENIHMANVLFVDDDLYFMKYTIQKLAEKGHHHVRTAANLGDAIAKVREGVETIIVLDKNIGGHRGCIPFIELVRRERPGVQIVMHSGEDSSLVPGHLGCDAFVFKGSSDREALLRVVNRWADKPRAETPKSKSFWDDAYGEDYYGDRL